MAEQRIHQATAVTAGQAAEADDRYFIKRVVGGQSQPFQLHHQDAAGDSPLQVVEVEVPVSDFYSGGTVELLPDISGAGQAYAVEWVYGLYSPGDTPHGAAREFRIMASDTGAYVLHRCTLDLQATGNAAMMTMTGGDSAESAELIIEPAASWTGGNGTLRFRVAFEVVDQ